MSITTATHESLLWLKAALECENFVWDVMQQAAAEDALAETVKNLSELRAAKNELIAWFTSGNSVPISQAEVMRKNPDKVFSDIVRLVKAAEALTG